MEQKERRLFLINELIKEQPEYAGIDIPAREETQKDLLRTLMNVRPPKPADSGFLAVQDEYLKAETSAKCIVDISDIRPLRDGIYVSMGDITALRCDAIVNAANSGMTGCYVPCHGCIDNCIHTFAGVQLRLACAELMEEQGHDEEAGTAKITPAFNLPSKYIIHTVGPIVGERVTEENKKTLASCYRACLETAEKNGCKSIAFCCISTGEYRFPNAAAAAIAVRTVKDWLAETGSGISVIFDVFKELDYEIYWNLLR